MSKIKFDRVTDVYDSDNVESIAYSFESKKLKVTFKTTAEYVYSNVSSHIFGYLCSSENLGSLLYTTITSRPQDFPYERVDI